MQDSEQLKHRTRKIRRAVLRKDALMLAPTLKQEMDDFVIAVATNKDLFRGEKFIQEVWWEIFAEDMLRQMTVQIRDTNLN